MITSILARLPFIKRVSIFLLLAVASMAAHAADVVREVRTGNGLRTYTIHLPVHLPDGLAWSGTLPLLLAFHGGGMTGAGMRRLSGLDASADRHGFIVVYPDGSAGHWNDGRATIRKPTDDVGFVAALLDDVEQHYPVDSGRVFATGMSNGALFAERLGCELSERIAAIAAVAGTLPAELAPQCRPLRPVAVMQINGLADPIMPYNGGMVEDFGGVGEGGRVLSVASTAAFWASHNGCGAAGPAQARPRASTPDALPDRTRIVEMRYSGCPAAGAVAVYTVVGGGHAWPGGQQYARPTVIGWATRQLDANEAISEFVLSLPRRR